MTISIIIILTGLVGSAFISATEAAILDSNRYKIENLLEEGDSRAKSVLKILNNYEQFFGTILLLGNMFNVVVATVGTTLAISTIGGGNPTVTSTIVATVISTILIVIIGELTPKTLAVLSSESIALKNAKVVNILIKITWPLVFIFTLFPKLIINILGGKDNLTKPIVTESELRTLIDLGEAEGTVEESKGEMLDNIFKFSEMEVRDLMTPRTEIIWIRTSTNFTDFMKVYNNNPHTRFPVFEDDQDNVVGILSVKDIISKIPSTSSPAEQIVTRLMRKPYFIPETKQVDDLFEEMQKFGHKIALVIDEFGGISGLITQSKLVEKIVGKSSEEGERIEKNYISINENTFVVDGSINIDDINNELELDIPEGDYETLAGFFLDNAQIIPTLGAKINFNNVRMEINEMIDSKITSIRITKVSEAKINPKKID
ncbi:MAG: hemolysin family protein [Dehalococcoidia bacterium]